MEFVGSNFEVEEVEHTEAGKEQDKVDIHTQCNHSRAEDSIHDTGEEEVGNIQN